MANNPYVNKVEYAGQTLMDLTGDTVTPSKVLNGETFHDRSGTPQQGSLELGDLAYKDSASGTFTPTGSVSKPNVDVTETKTTIKEVDSAGSVTPGSANTPTVVTLPDLTMSVSNETLIFSWYAGSVTPGTAGTPTQVTLPTTKETSVVTGVSAELDSTPAFTGTAGSVSVS